MPWREPSLGTRNATARLLGSTSRKEWNFSPSVLLISRPRMPAAMHSFYLRSLYMRNELAAGQLELAGQPLSLAAVRNDTYVVGAINDHIVPWHSSYKTGALLGGDVRYVLSSGGHIAGIVNPPGPRAW